MWSCVTIICVMVYPRESQWQRSRTKDAGRYLRVLFVIAASGGSFNVAILL